MSPQAIARVSPWHTLRQMLELIRFSHTVFALPFVLLTAVIAWNAPAATAVRFEWRWLAGILVSMVGARSAAMAFNRIVDRRFDAANLRTAGRHLPAGQLSVQSVALFTVASSLVFLAGTLMFLPNWLPAAVALPVLAVLLGYSFAKRFTALSHFWLGFALALAPLCTWLGVRGSEVLGNWLDILPALAIGLVVLLWVSGFDIIYACQDAEYDRQARLHSLPARLGTARALRVAAGLHFATVIAVLLVPATPWLGGPATGLGMLWWIAAVLLAGLLAWEHRLVRPDDLSRVNIAFFHVNAIISGGLLLFGAVDVLTG